MAAAVTGLGIVSPLGIGRDAWRTGLRERRANIGPPTLFDASIYEVQRAAEVPDFDPKQFVESPKTYLDRCSALTLASCYLAVRDAGLPLQDVQPERRSLSHGTAFGCLDSMMLVSERMAAHGPRAASPMIFTHAFMNSPASLAAIEYSVRGPAATFVNGSFAGAEALEYGLALVAEGEVDFCLAGAADALSEPLYAALDEAGETARGIIPAEAGVMLVLEPLEAAQARGAEVAAIIHGCVVAGDLDEARQALGLPPDAQPVQLDVFWGDAMGTAFPLLVAAAIDWPGLPRDEQLFIAMATSSGAAGVVVEVIG